MESFCVIPSSKYLHKVLWNVCGKWNEKVFGVWTFTLVVKVLLRCHISPSDCLGLSPGSALNSSFLLMDTLQSSRGRWVSDWTGSSWLQPGPVTVGMEEVSQGEVLSLLISLSASPSTVKKWLREDIKPNSQDTHSILEYLGFEGAPPLHQPKQTCAGIVAASFGLA